MLESRSITSLEKKKGLALQVGTSRKWISRSPDRAGTRKSAIKTEMRDGVPPGRTAFAKSKSGLFPALAVPGVRVREVRWACLSQNQSENSETSRFLYLLDTPNRATAWGIVRTRQLDYTSEEQNSWDYMRATLSYRDASLFRAALARVSTSVLTCSVHTRAAEIGSGARKKYARSERLTEVAFLRRRPDISLAV